jgi:hypothetical protein
VSVSSTQGTDEEPDLYALDLSGLQTELSRLQSRYTDKHPDIIKLKSRIKELEQEQVAPSGNGTPSARTYVPLPLREAQNEINAYESDIQNIQLQIRQYEERVEATPRREQELLALQRDYANLQEAYQNLLNRKLEAEISVNMERKQKGEQFRILDRAQIPKRPVEPNMQMIFLMTLAIGFGFGSAIIGASLFMTKAFHSPREIEDLLGLPTLAMITIIEDRRMKIIRWVNSGATFISIGITIAALVFFTSLTFRGVESTIALLSKLKISI